MLQVHTLPEQYNQRVGYLFLIDSGVKNQVPNTTAQ